MEKIQYITQDNAELSHAEQAKAMFGHGVAWVQLRMKNASKGDMVAEAKKILAFADELGGTLILNDDVALAKELGVKAVHLGLGDMPIDEARQVLGADVIIGGTANTLEQIKLQVERGADYVGVGPFRFTTTKKNLSPVVGLDGYKTLMSQLKEAGIEIPLFAVGGITMNDVVDLAVVGVAHYAISGDLLKCHLNGEFDKIKELLA